MALEERLKQRLLGGAVLVALVVIFVPMLIDEPVDSKVVSDHRIPAKPETLEKPMPAILPPSPAESATPVEVPKNQPSKEKVQAQTPTPVVQAQTPTPVVKPKTIRVDKPSPSAWMIQVASLTIKGNADKLVADLKKAELPAIVEKVEVEGKRHYRVRVGPEVNHKTALSMAERIKRDFKLTPKVLRYPD
jgi:DedD protein